MAWTTRPVIYAGQYPRGDQIEAILDQIDSLTDRFQYTAISADTAGNSTTTAADVTGLSVTCAANSRYSFSGLLLYTTPAANDFNFSITSPTGCTMAHWGFGITLVPAGVDDGDGRFAATTLTTGLIVSVGGAGATPMGFLWTGSIATGNTAGTLQPRYAAQTAGGAAVVKSGSFLWAIKTS